MDEKYRIENAWNRFHNGLYRYDKSFPANLFPALLMYAYAIGIKDYVEINKRISNSKLALELKSEYQTVLLDSVTALEVEAEGQIVAASRLPKKPTDK